jgi:hypothetical protein
LQPARQDTFISKVAKFLVQTSQLKCDSLIYVPGELSAIEILKDKPQGIISYFAPHVGDHHLAILLGSFSADCE